MVPPPAPFHILRSHNAPLSALSFNPNNTVLYAGDQDGYVSIIDLAKRRAVSHWKAHESGVLGVDELDGALISQGRDHILHVYEPRKGPQFSSGPGPSRPPPAIGKSLEINALNFCRFSLCRLPTELRRSKGATSRVASASLHSEHSSPKGKEKANDVGDMDSEDTALLAVPNLVDSELADIYLLPSMTRLHAALNLPPPSESKATPLPKDNIAPGPLRTGLVMSLQVGFDAQRRLCLVLGYEDGRVEMWRLPEDEAVGERGGEPEVFSWRTKTDSRLEQAAGKRSWERVFESKGHNEAVMAMAVSSDLISAYTVSADHLICRYTLEDGHKEDTSAKIKSMNTGQIGNASLAISPDDKVVAVGGWDGNIRLFSAATLKPLGKLGFHRETVHVLAFASRCPTGSATSSPGTLIDEASTIELGAGSDDESDDEEVYGVAGDGVPRSRWLASGGKDKRIALWGLKDFARMDG